MATTSVQPSKNKAFRKIMTWNTSKDSKKHGHLFGYDSAQDDGLTLAPASPTPSFKSVKNGRPSLFAAFARRNSTKSLSEHSSRSRSPTSPRPSTEYGISAEGFRTPSPTPSRNSMIFERDIETHDRLSVHEAIDLAIPPVLDEAADAFASDDMPTILTENGDETFGSESNENNANPWGNRAVDEQKRLSAGNIADINNRQPNLTSFEQTPNIAETLRVTTPKEMNGLTGILDNPWNN